MIPVLPFTVVLKTIQGYFLSFTGVIYMKMKSYILFLNQFSHEM
jgi:hypothetical protein